MTRGIARLAALLTFALLAASVALPIPAGAAPAAAPSLVDGSTSREAAGRVRHLDPATEAFTQPSGRAFVPGVVLVGYRDDASAGDRAAARRAIHAAGHRQVSKLAPGLERLELAAGTSVEAAVKALRGRHGVRFAEPDYIVTPDHDANDWVYTDGNLWGMEAGGYGSAAADAWQANQIGSRNVYVAVVDTGIDIRHKDLAPNIWTNQGETAGNGIDDDGNGYIDDVHGWDFFHGDAGVFDSAASDYHGTHVAGTIGGAGGNAEGVAGVNWAVTIIPAKFIDGEGDTAGAIEALDYVTDLKVNHGLNIVATNNSWGGDEQSQALEDAINRGGDAGILFVASAGNSGVDIDLTPTYPASQACDTRYDNDQPRGYDCLISVAAIDEAGALAGFSNHGSTSVDIGAPGVQVASTYPGDNYVYLNGTSMAAPHVTGALALLASCQAAPTAQALETSLYGNAVATPSLAGVTSTAKRVSAGAMMADCGTGLAPRAYITGVAGGTDTPADFWAYFSEPISDFTTDDLTIGGTSSGWSLEYAQATTGNARWVIRANATSPPAGTLSLTLAAGSVTGVSLTGPASPFTVTTIVDVTPPTATAPTASIGTGVPLSGSAIPVKISWRPTDAESGIHLAIIYYSTDGGATWSILSSYFIGSTVYLYLPSSGSFRFRVRVYDWAGHYGNSPAGPNFSPRLNQEGAAAIAYPVAWSKGTSSNFSGSAVRYTSTGGRSAVFTVSARSVGLVTTLALNRGVVKVFVDGVLAARIDLGKPLVYRQVVWSKTFATVKTHKVKLVVVGGYGRVDLDAFAVLK